jgi:thymidylate synthase
MSIGNIPVINVSGKTLPEAWEKAVLAVWEQGCRVKTQYDKPEDPPSRDATGIVIVEDPFAEPRIHKNFPGGPEELESYRQEVIDGIHNHWIDPENGKWTYTYNERLFEYSPCEDLSHSDSVRPFTPVDQIQYIIDYMAKSGHTRRAQAITWQPNCDPQTYDPPCLQRIWCRMMDDEEGNPILNMNTHWRSRDLYRAWYMNVFALTDLQRIMAEKISEKIGKTVKVGRYVDMSDSLHLYGSYLNDIEPEIEKMMTTSVDGRSWPTDHPAFKMMTEEARENLRKNPDHYAKGDR